MSGIPPIVVKIPAIVEIWENRIKENDRSLAIIGAALLDEQLAELLKSFFIVNKKVTDTLLSPTGALGAFGVRNQLAYVLGLIDKPTYDDIKTIQKIRNKFAHVSSDIDFTDDNLCILAESLRIPKHVGDPEDEDPSSPRGQFFSGVRGILWHLSTESHRIRKEGRRQEPEPIFPLGDRQGLEFEELT